MMHKTLLFADICDKGARLHNQQGAEPVNADEIAVCRRWIAMFANRRRTINSGSSSYGLKHCVEEASSQSVYVSNGAFICAALEAGFTAVQCESRSPNCYFNMGTTAWRRLPVDSQGKRRGRHSNLLIPVNENLKEQLDVRA